MQKIIEKRLKNFDSLNGNNFSNTFRVLNIADFLLLKQFYQDLYILTPAVLSFVVGNDVYIPL